MSEDEEFGELIVLDGTGDSTKKWRKSRKKKAEPTVPPGAAGEVVEVDILKPAELDPELEASRKLFDERIADGWKAYSVKSRGRLLEQSREIRRFDPEADHILMSPPPAGGKN